MTWSRIFLASVALAHLAACGSSPVSTERYYSLVLAADSGAVPANEPTDARLIIGPIELPTYLSNRGIAMQTGPNQIESANHHFWAEPLDEAIAKVLVRDIGERVDGISVERESGRWTSDGDCRVRVEFDAFHPTSDSRVVSGGRYWILSESLNGNQAFSLSNTLTVDGYAHAVDALRSTLELLAQQIAEDVSATPACIGNPQPAI